MPATRVTGAAAWPLYRIDDHARSQPLGTLRQRAEGGFHFDSHVARPALCHDGSIEGGARGLPWFLHDLRPSGFAGRAYARQVAAELDLPCDPDRWTEQHCLAALLDHGSAHSGDIVVGERAREQALRQAAAPAQVLDRTARATHYPLLADAALRGEEVGAPVAGQQPKFAATVHDASGHVPVIVKFSAGVTTPGGRRWADLLISEQHAGEVLQRNAVPASRSELLEADTRVFLESERFDRTRVLGRRGLVSLAALDAAFYRHGRIGWRGFAALLEADGWINAKDARLLRVIAWFGDLIANTDMHLGNVSLRLADVRPLTLAPVYDMLPMRFRPSRNGAVVEHRYEIALPTREALDDWTPAAHMAQQFWHRVGADERVSPAFRRIADDGYRAVSRAIGHLCG